VGRDPAAVFESAASLVVAHGIERPGARRGIGTAPGLEPLRRRLAEVRGGEEGSGFETVGSGGESDRFDLLVLGLDSPGDAPPAETILEARRLVVVVCGESGATALGEACAGAVDADRPTTVVAIHPDLTVLADPIAARVLSGGAALREVVPPIEIFREGTFPGRGGVVVVSPHPDDASLGCGGLLARLAGTRSVTVLGMTSGHRAEIPDTTREDRIEIRRDELARECAVLGVGLRPLDLSFYDDGYSFRGDDLDRVESSLRELEADWILTPSRNDLHPAHRASARLVWAAVLRRAGRGESRGPVELWEFEGPWHLHGPGEANAVVPLTPQERRTRREAAAAHSSQMNRARYDLAADGLAIYRAVTTPEVCLGGFGAGRVDLGEGAELYRRIRLRGR
jgi:LmbE family N-acetylglucosaminyl deacetylase